MEGFIAQIIMFGGNFAPRNWAFCQGQILSIAQNTALFSLLGTTYGGNGQTTFALPNLMSRTSIGVGTGPGLSNIFLGENLGAENLTLTINNLPVHNHLTTANIKVSSGNPTTDDPSGSLLTAGNDDEYASVGSANGNMGGTSMNLLNAGGNQPFSKSQPYLGISFVICLAGIYPARN